jgi:ROK family
MPPMALRIGIDLGGTKIEGVVIDSDERVLVRERIATPRHDYIATVAAVVGLAKALAQHDGAAAPVGIGTPGAWGSRCADDEELQLHMAERSSVAGRRRSTAWSKGQDRERRGLSRRFRST